MARPANPRLASEILRVTGELVEERGAERVTMQEVAKRIGYSPTTIYLYYKNKGELVDKAVTRGFERLADHLARASTAADPVEQIHARSHAYAEWAIRNPALYRLMLESPRDSQLPDEDVQTRARVWFTNRTYFAEAKQSGRWPGIEDVDAATNLSWASLHGLTSLAVSSRLSLTGETFHEERALSDTRPLVDMLLHQLECAWGPDSKQGPTPRRAADRQDATLAK